ncbi:MAG TPA: FAD-binding oxidoreductase [Gaiellales bacterium]|nr:FAD-binding oxidoreductase [Gaiellales bacterium]
MPRVRSLWQIEAEAPVFARLDGDASADVVVVGAGVTGLACARRLQADGRSVVVVDGREVAGGASGRNGGFASTGSEVRFSEAVERLGRDGATRLHRATEGAFAEMCTLAEELGIAEAVAPTGGLGLAAAGEEADAARADVVAMQECGIDCRLAPDMIPEWMRPWYETAVHMPGDGALQPARWVRALAGLAASDGVTIVEHAPVREVRSVGGGWEASTPAGTITADAVVVACDGLISSLVPELDGITLPVRGQMLATAAAEPVLAMPTWSEAGWTYYRQLGDGRIVIGGARRTSLDDEFTDVEAVTAVVQDEVERFVHERLGVTAPVTHRWAGIMGFSADMLPVVGEVPGRPRLFVSGGYSGVGNVQGYLCGQIAADLVMGRPHPSAAPYALSRFAA